MIKNQDYGGSMDEELKAMNDVYSAVKDLDQEARNRVITWLVSKLSVDQPKKVVDTFFFPTQTQNNKSLGGYDSIADLFGHAIFKTESDKALLAAAFLQSKTEDDLTSRDIHKELIHLGHGVTNITAAIRPLIHQKPSLMIQTRKEGKSQQAQKKYKVTAEGMKTVELMLQNPVK
jgi:hypothetical protein